MPNLIKQLSLLKTCYSANPRPDALIKEQLVEMTGLSSRVIRVWFQNKRCKDKKKLAMKHGKVRGSYLARPAQPAAVACREWKLSRNMCTRCVHVLGTLDADLYARSVLTNKISASELRRKFIEGVLLVGCLLKVFVLIRRERAEIEQQSLSSA